MKTSFHEGSVHRGNQEETGRTSNPGRLAPSFVTLSPGGTRQGHGITRARMGTGTLGVMVLGGAVAVGWQPLQNSGSAGRANAHPFAILGSPAGAPFWPNPTRSWRDPVHGVEAQENRAGRRSTENRSALGGKRR